MESREKNTHAICFVVHFIHLLQFFLFFFVIWFFFLSYSETLHHSWLIKEKFFVFAVFSGFTIIFNWQIYFLFHIFFFSSFHLANYYQNIMDSRFYCSTCGRNYVRKKHVLRHIRYECVNVPPRFYCANCTKFYRQSNALLHHVRQKHGPLAKDTFNANGYTQRNFKVADDGRVIFSCF